MKKLTNKKFKEILALTEKCTGLKPYKEQIKASKELFKGNIIEMKTGEGKSLVVLMATAMLASSGRKVYVCSSNDYLVKRDYEYGLPLYEKLGLKAVWLKEHEGGEEEVYANNDIIYATGATLIFDYLRGIRADLDIAIIDEVDFILIENSNHQYSVSDGSNDRNIESTPYKIAESIIKQFSFLQIEEKYRKEDYNYDYQRHFDAIIDKYSTFATITERGYDKIYDILNGISEDKRLEIIEIIGSSIVANLVYEKGKHYIVQDDKIVLIDDSTGRLSPNGRNGVELHTALEVKENVPITKKSHIGNTCSYTVFFSLFKEIVGLSGTADSAREDFNTLFKKRVVKIAEHSKNKRTRKDIFVEDQKGVIEEIEKIAKKHSKSPILIVADSDKRASFIAKKLDVFDRNIVILDNGKLGIEDVIIDSIPRHNDIVISSKIVGRGTDIKKPRGSEDGLIVVLAQRFYSERVEQQAIGRTGRNGEKGYAYVITSKDDKIFTSVPKNRKSIKEVKRIQKKYEKHEINARKIVYIDSKLFFDEDEAVRNFLSDIKSFKGIKKYIKHIEPLSEDTRVLKEECGRLLNEAEGMGIVWCDTHNMLCKMYYEKIRLEYQHQFLRYIRLMSHLLNDTQGFYEISKMFLDISNSVILTILCMVLTKACFVQKTAC